MANVEATAVPPAAINITNISTGTDTHEGSSDADINAWLLDAPRQRRATNENALARSDTTTASAPIARTATAVSAANDIIKTAKAYATTAKAKTRDIVTPDIAAGGEANAEGARGSNVATAAGGEDDEGAPGSDTATAAYSRCCRRLSIMKTQRGPV